MLQIWQDLWDIIWNLLVAAVSLNWNGVLANLQAFLDWWDRLWHLITVRLQNLWNSLNNIIDWASQEFYNIRLSIGTKVGEAWDGLVTFVDTIRLALLDEIATVGAYIDNAIDAVKLWVTDLLQDLLDTAIVALTPYIDAAKTWVLDTFGWILDYYVLIVNWLASVRDAVTWLVSQAWASLQAFLADPWGFVLGELGATIINMVNWWLQWAEPLTNLVALDLGPLLSVIEVGKDFLLSFMADPLQMILDLLYPVFLDWLEDLIAENW